MPNCVIDILKCCNYLLKLVVMLRAVMYVIIINMKANSEAIS